ncbi:hypothetical protein PAXRUDRAFT_138509 [Paxillus rubicundulus Ve08.2h10]|uniref:C3H1-type domain-containing protein n=1 Tax=Paxillus rubicundulus Ve08.2h10 TaxID=930991 RepID=A0A0D0E012_9AGAM|nr:hypothetical protein PAXRUDRAFT_138509 [Paxillus rubicundulus Ve08.2h10]
MPPKKQNAPSSSKVKEDKTFGLKNKNKSAKVQKQVQQIQAQAAASGKSREALAKEKEKDLRAKEKLEEEKRKKEEAALFKPVQTQKVPFGVDPKTILCAFYKAGNCDKGTKCKFSHDLNVGRKVDKKNLYEDSREEKLQDTMEDWDDEKLRSVVSSKHGNPRTTTDIVCRHFIEAIETKKFGWFWECPNGGEKCQYRHALPPGFVLKSERKAAEEAAKANVISLEDFLETERHKLGPNLTPVTLETFATWKKTRMNKKEAEAEAMRKTKEAQHAAGKNTGMSGRDLFQYNPEWFEDQDDGEESDEFDLSKYRRDQEELYAELRETGQGDSDVRLYNDDDADGGGSSGGGSEGDK